jgi:hypothetical protein
MPESNLFAEAIADAKAVRATALANAKVALEEAFSQRYHAMFAEKLKEDANAPVAPSAPAAGAPAPAQGDDSVSAQEIDELIKELEAEVGQNPDPNAPPAAPFDGAGVPPAVPGAIPPPAVPGAVPPMGGVCPPPAVPGVPGVPGAVGAVPPMPPVPPVPPVDGAAVPPPAAPSPDGVSQTPPTSDVPPTGQEETDEEVNLEELLEDLKKDMESDEDKDKLEEDTKLTSSGIGGKVGVPSGKMPANGTRSSSTIAGGKHQETGVPEGKVTAKEPTNATRPNSIGVGIENTPKLTNENKVETGVPEGKVTAKEPTEASRPNSIGVGIEDTPKLEEVVKEKNALKSQLAEAVKAITFVRGQLNEVNLLNAKLLYTNKLFKEFQLTNEQKMRVVEMFDLNKNVREVKLTYANLAEAMNFSGDSRRKITSSVQAITEGLASNAVGNTKPNQQIISEGKANVMVAKFQRLAGIKAPVTKK